MTRDGNTSGEHGVAGAAPVWTAATRDRDEVRVARYTYRDGAQQGAQATQPDNPAEGG
jgi:hypothetical protein